MAEQAEVAFVKNFANSLSVQPVTYPDDFQPPPENYLKRVPVLPVRVHIHPYMYDINQRSFYHRLNFQSLRNVNTPKRLQQVCMTLLHV